MTARERAKKATQSAGMPQWDSNNQEELEMAVEQAITAAVEEEREECAKVAEEMLNRGYMGRDVIVAIRARRDDGGTK